MDSRPGAGAAVPCRAAAVPHAGPGSAHRKRPDCFYKEDVTWTWRKNFFVTMVECRNEAGAAAGARGGAAAWKGQKGSHTPSSRESKAALNGSVST